MATATNKTRSVRGDRSVLFFSKRLAFPRASYQKILYYVPPEGSVVPGVFWYLVPGSVPSVGATNWRSFRSHATLWPTTTSTMRTRQRRWRMKIVQMSDVHVGSGLFREDLLEATIEETNAMGPDLVVV